MVDGRPGPAPRLLPANITEEQLREVVAANRSWRAVMRALGLNSSSYGPKLRNACNDLDVDYSHFRSILATDKRLRDVIAESTDWPTALAKLGYARGSGTARATVRKHCNRLGIDTAHLAKTSTRRDGQGGSWVCSLSRSEYDLTSSGGHRLAVYSSEEIDFFACIDGDLKLHFIPVGALEGMHRINLRKYVAYQVPTLYDGRLW